MERAEKNNQISGQTERLVVWGAVVLCAVVCFFLTRNNNVWMDEAFTATLVKTDLAGVLQRSMNDTLPPLYNILLKLFTDLFGYRVSVMKLFSSLFIVLTAVLGATVVRRRFGFITSLIFILSLITMPNMLFFAVEIRMYSLGFFCATASGIYAYECIAESNRKNWCLFTFFSVLAGYSHHFAFVTAGFVYLYLLLYLIKYEREQIKRFFLCVLATFLLYLPCMIVTLRQLKQVSGYFSMPEITPAVFVKYMRYPFTVGFTPLSILLLLVFCALVIRYFFTAARSDARRSANDVPINHFIPAYFLIYYCVLLFGTVVSKVMTANIFVDRYLFFAIGLLWLFFAIEAGTLQKPLVYGILILELLAGIAGFLQAYQSEYAGNAEELIAFLEENVKPGDQLYTLEDAEGLSLSLPFYDDALTNVESPDDLDPDKTIWCAILTGYDYSPKELDGFSLEPVGDFAFDRYQFSLYKMTKDPQK
ncbi:MAG: glycosyltransferase family 39 protein [Lachnospiraceae bacterium]|nr:glycosyltransferase family 39 protein [Lachnospiraceae bacterium]